MEFLLQTLRAGWLHEARAYPKIEWNTLLLTALSTSNNKEGEKIDRRRRSIARSSVRIHNLASNRRGRLRFVLTP
jgi:hypothetical protein